MEKQKEVAYIPRYEEVYAAAVTLNQRDLDKLLTTLTEHKESLNTDLNRKAEMVFARWNIVAKEMGFPTMRKLTDKIKKRLRSRLQSIPDKRDWAELFSRLKQSAYLAKEPWFNFMYVIRDDVCFDKIKTGAFDWKDTGRREESSSLEAPEEEIGEEDRL